MTEFRPGTSPPPVRMPIRFFAMTTPLLQLRFPRAYASRAIAARAAASSFFLAASTFGYTLRDFVSRHAAAPVSGGQSTLAQLWPQRAEAVPLHAAESWPARSPRFQRCHFFATEITHKRAMRRTTNA